MVESGVAIVTGASRGIGCAIATTLAKQGWTVAGTATTDSGADTISSHLSDQGLSGRGFSLDVSDVNSVNQFFSAMREFFPPATVLVNNAGITDDNLFLRMRQEQWDQVIATNLSAIYHMTKACLKPMLKARWGRVVNVTSVVASTGNPGQANYCASKAGMIGVTKSLALEYAARGITFNSVAPGFIDTEMTAALNQEQRASILDGIPMGHMGEVEDIAAAVAFLVSDHAKYISGQTLHVNGGMYMG